MPPASITDDGRAPTTAMTGRQIFAAAGEGRPPRVLDQPQLWPS